MEVGAAWGCCVAVIGSDVTNTTISQALVALTDAAHQVSSFFYKQEKQCLSKEYNEMV